MGIKRRFLAVGGLAAATGVSAAVIAALPRDPAPSGVPLERAIGERRPDLRKISLRIEKSAYRLTVSYNGRPVKTYPVVLGGCPTNDKLRKGDRCTPEGTFHVRALYPHKDWSRFIWLDYPTS